MYCVYDCESIRLREAYGGHSGIDGARAARPAKCGGIGSYSD